ncbi:MAG: polysaccharide pyruvyl transferase family protein [Gammaproteobacteria bacterium]|nr:polysaccharide pyruvyl transferase family protein [Gammaproteobacteria bacterium]
MKLYYHLDPQGNVGDDLNPWLWRLLLPQYFSGTVVHDPRLREADITDEALFVGIGTLLNQHVPALPKKAVFGTGAGYGPTPHLDDSWIVYCVRGPLTAARLGLAPETAVTDAAALCAVLDLGPCSVEHAFSFMPHCSTAKSGAWQQVCEDLAINYIDPRWPVERVFRAIRSTGTLITEAMHGAILADTFRVPWVSVSTSPGILEFKWQDWCRSLGMEHEWVRLPTLWTDGGEGGFLSRSKSYIKHRLARRQLQQVSRRARPTLSNEQRFRDAVGELQLRLERFKTDVETGRYG